MKVLSRTGLVVDHDPALRCSLESALAPFGYRILTADSVETACALLGSESVDAVLFESHLPTMSGLAFYDAVVSGWQALDRRIAFITGDAEATDVQPWLRRHHCTVFRKPCRFRRLLKWLDAAARRAPATLTGNAQ